MNTQQAYINGFVKRAAEYGLGHDEAIGILKNANALTRALARGAVKPSTIASRMNIPLGAVKSIAGYNTPGKGINLNPNIQKLDKVLARRNNLSGIQERTKPMVDRLSDKYENLEEMYSDGQRMQQGKFRNWDGERIGRTRQANILMSGVMDKKPQIDQANRYLMNAGSRGGIRNQQIGALDAEAYNLGAPLHTMSNPGAVVPGATTIDNYKQLSPGAFHNYYGVARPPSKFHPDAKRTGQAFDARDALRSLRQTQNQGATIVY